MGKKFLGLGGTDHFWDRAKAWILGQITSAVAAKIAEVVANAPEDLDTLKEIADWISAHADDAAAMNTQIQTNKNNIAALSDDAAAMNTQITENKNNIAALSDNAAAMNTQIQTNKNNIAANTSDITALKTSVAGKADKSHTHTKSQITDFPTSLPANGGTADHANVPTGFEKIGNQDPWGNQDGVFITDWQTVQKKDLVDSGNISFRFNNGQLNLIIDGFFYQNEGNYKLVDENSIKNIMKPNYTTGRLPGGVYKTGQTVSVSASITTTRGNPVFISYSGDFNSVNPGGTVPWISFCLYADDQLVQRTVVDDSVAFESDNTPFAGNALAVLSAGSHTIRLDAVLIGGTSGQVQFQEQDNLVNLVAFEL